MKNRTKWLSITRWSHADGSFTLTWPMLHHVSFYGRTALICELVCPLLVVPLIIFMQDKPVAETLSRIAAFRPTTLLLVALAVPPILFVLDQLLRSRLRIAPEQIELRHPWGTRKTYRRSSLEGVQMDEHVFERSERGPTRVGIVQLIIRDQDGARQRLAVGGTMGTSVAHDLVREIGRYTRIQAPPTIK